MQSSIRAIAWRYPLPSWNNNHYIHMLGARGVPIPCRADSRFLPTLDDLAPELPSARLVCLNSPLNPTGTAIDPEVLRGISEAIVAENERRASASRAPALPDVRPDLLAAVRR